MNLHVIIYFCKLVLLKSTVRTLFSKWFKNNFFVIAAEQQVFFSLLEETLFPDLLLQVCLSVDFLQGIQCVLVLTWTQILCCSTAFSFARQVNQTLQLIVVDYLMPCGHIQIPMTLPSLEFCELFTPQTLRMN